MNFIKKLFAPQPTPEPVHGRILRLGVMNGREFHICLQFMLENDANVYDYETGVGDFSDQRFALSKSGDEVSFVVGKKSAEGTVAVKEFRNLTVEQVCSPAQRNKVAAW